MSVYRTLSPELSNKLDMIDTNRVTSGWIKTADGYTRVYDSRVALNIIAQDIMLSELSRLSASKLEDK